MTQDPRSDPWERGDAYERYVGRWSRQLAPRFLAWMHLPPGRKWLDVGCGTGALCAAILEHCSPASVAGVDPSEGFLEYLFAAAGLEDIAVGPLDIPTRFTSFDDFWQPFLGGQGPAPAYVLSLAPPARERLRQGLQARLPLGAHGAIALTARAWAVSATVGDRPASEAGSG